MKRETRYGINSFRADFPDEVACLEFVFDALHSRKCSCGGEYRLITGRRQFQCSQCRFQIAPTAGTIFHKSQTPLMLWFHAIHVFSNAKSGVSAAEMERQLEVTYKTAWRILSLIRKALKQSKEPLSGIVEMDSAYLGGRHYGGKNNEQLGQAMKKKSVVTIAVSRGGKIRAKVADNVTANELESFMISNIQEGSTLMTDGATTYKRVRDVYDLQSVNHSKNEYVKGDRHVNTIETWIAHIKSSIRGTYKVISKQHLQSYLDAFVFHYNNRHSDKARFEALLGTLLHA